MTEGRPVLVIEVARTSSKDTSTDLAEWARRCVAGGAEALAVPTDAGDTPTGLADLLTVCRATRCPVLRRDWILHPLQVGGS
jgi:indole-3-glycerol phosphate synthase